MIVNIGKGIEMDVTVEAIPANALEHVIKIGLRNILMDSHAGVNAKANPELSAEDVVAQSRAVAEKKLAALMAGEVRTAGTRTAKAGVDPVRAEAVRIATAAIKLALKTKGVAINTVGKDKMETYIAQYLAKYPKTLEDAKANLEAAEGIDLGDLV